MGSVRSSRFRQHENTMINNKKVFTYRWRYWAINLVILIAFLVLQLGIQRSFSALEVVFITILVGMLLYGQLMKLIWPCQVTITDTELRAERILRQPVSISWESVRSVRKGYARVLGYPCSIVDAKDGSSITVVASIKGYKEFEEELRKKCPSR